MAVTAVKEIGGRDLEVDEELKRTYRRQFRVRVDDQTDGPIQVISAMGIPRRYDPYVLVVNGLISEYDLGAYCIGVNPVQDADNPYVWIVTATYSSATIDPADVGQTPGTQGNTGQGPQNTQTPPLQKPVKIRYGLKHFTKPLRLHIDYAAPTEFQTVKNSAGQQFIPLLEIEQGRLTITVTRNEALYPVAVALAFQNTINSAAWNSFPKWTVKCNGITADKTFEEGLKFWVVTYEFEVDPKDWRFKVYDAGLEEVDPDDTTKLKKIVDKFGQPVTEPHFLDGSGAALPADAAEADYELLYFNGYPETNFATLNISLA